jgi:hypothetical protein
VGGQVDWNLTAIDSVELMRFLGDLATQINDPSDSTTIDLKILD